LSTNKDRRGKFQKLDFDLFETAHHLDLSPEEVLEAMEELKKAGLMLFADDLNDSIAAYLPIDKTAEQIMQEAAAVINAANEKAYLV